MSTNVRNQEDKDPIGCDDVLRMMHILATESFSTLGLYPPPRDLTEDQVIGCSEARLRKIKYDPSVMNNRQLLFLHRVALWWSWSGMPVVDIGDKLAASFCCSRADNGMESLLVTPWKAFVIRLPPGLITFSGPEGDVEHGVLIRVFYGPCKINGVDTEGWDFDLIGQRSNLWQTALSTRDLIHGVDVMNLLVGRDKVLPPDPIDIRALNLARAVIRGVVLLCNDPDKKHSYQRLSGTSTKVKKSRIRRYGADLMFDHYVVTEPISIDLRDVVRRYLGGERSSPSVQHLVRGHFKRQPHGVGRTDRKTVFVQPYWRGEEGLPIAVHNYNVSDRRG